MLSVGEETQPSPPVEFAAQNRVVRAAVAALSVEHFAVLHERSLSHNPALTHPLRDHGASPLPACARARSCASSCPRVEGARVPPFVLFLFLTTPEQNKCLQNTQAAPSPSLAMQAAPHDALRLGLPALKEDAAPRHPVDEIQTAVR